MMNKDTEDYINKSIKLLAIYLLPILIERQENVRSGNNLTLKEMLYYSVDSKRDKTYWGNLIPLLLVNSNKDIMGEIIAAYELDKEAFNIARASNE